MCVMFDAIILSCEGTVSPSRMCKGKENGGGGKYYNFASFMLEFVFVSVLLKYFIQMFWLS